jgi:hypothetical protein
MRKRIKYRIVRADNGYKAQVKTLFGWRNFIVPYYKYHPEFFVYYRSGSTILMSQFSENLETMLRFCVDSPVYYKGHKIIVGQCDISSSKLVFLDTDSKYFIGEGGIRNGYRVGTFSLSGLKYEIDRRIATQIATDSLSKQKEIEDTEVIKELSKYDLLCK